MSNLQYAVIIALSLASAVSVFAFDKRGRTHKPLLSFAAFLMFVKNGGLVIAAAVKADNLVLWLLILGLAVHTGCIVAARGNIGRIPTRQERNEP